MPALYATGDQVHMEAPAGIIDEGTPEENARREVLEEVGIQLHNLEHVSTSWSCAGISTEQIHLYLAPYRQSDRKADGGGADGEHENIKVLELSLSEVGRMADQGELVDLRTLTLVLALRSRKPDLFDDSLMPPGVS